MTKQLVRNQDLASDVYRRNQTINGGLEHWQRGNGPFTVSGTYTADQWFLGLNGTDTMSVSKNTIILDTGSLACAALNFTLGTGGGATNISQFIKVADGYQIKGKTFTWSVRLNTNVANAVRLGLVYDGTGGTTLVSLAHSGNGVYQTLSVTATIPNDATFMRLQVLLMATNIVYIDNTMLVYGSVVPDYIAMPPADDLARSKRYYYETYPSNDGVLVVSGYGAASGQHYHYMGQHPAEMATNPTVTKVGTWTVTNCGQPTLFANPRGWNVRATITALGEYYFGADGITGGSKATLEANP